MNWKTFKTKIEACGINNDDQIAIAIHSIENPCQFLSVREIANVEVCHFSKKAISIFPAEE